jgi:hypothetical protein
VKPILFSLDCSPQLQSAVLDTFARCPDLARLVYSNLILVHLQYFDSIACSVEEDHLGTLKSTAIKVMDSLDQYGIDIFLKECKSHVWRAPCHWVHISKVPEIVNERARFGSMVSGLFKALLEYKNVTEAIASLAVVVAMLETEEFNIEIKEPFMDKSSVQTERSDEDRQKESEYAHGIERWASVCYSSLSS